MKKKKLRSKEPTFTPRQQAALTALRSGRSIFLTGAAGVGKSFLLKYFIEESKKSKKKIMVTAPTGIAAVNVSGSTIHRSIGWPTNQLNQKPSPREELIAADILVIDEVSMMRIDLFDRVISDVLEANNIRKSKNKNPIQMVLCGDFCQLLPIVKGNSRTAKKTDREELSFLKQLFPYAGEKFYAFEHKKWAFPTFELTEVVRQEDPAFAEALNKIRIGDPSGLDYINQSRSKDPIPNAIKVMGNNSEVDARNEEEVQKLKPLKLYKARSIGKVSNDEKKAPERLNLGVGARVVALVNSPGFYANGSTGTVKELHTDHVVVNFDNGKEVEVPYYKWSITEYRKEEDELRQDEIGSYTQIPLKLGYAATVHKSQGMTYNQMEADPSVWDPGQLYVELSRVTDAKQMYLTRPLRKSDLKTDPNVLNFYQHPKVLDYEYPNIEAVDADIEEDDSEETIPSPKEMSNEELQERVLNQNLQIKKETMPMIDNIKPELQKEEKKTQLNMRATPSTKETLKQALNAIAPDLDQDGQLLALANSFLNSVAATGATGSDKDLLEDVSNACNTVLTAFKLLIERKATAQERAEALVNDKIERLERMVTNLQNQNSTLESSNKELKEQNKELSTVKKALEKTESDLSVAKELREVLAEKVAFMEADAVKGVRYDELKIQFDSLEREHELLKERFDEKKADLDEKKAEFTSLQMQLARETADSIDRMDAARAEGRKIEKEIAEAKIKALEEALDAEKVKAAADRAELDRYRAEKVVAQMAGE